MRMRQSSLLVSAGAGAALLAICGLQPAMGLGPSAAEPRPELGVPEVQGEIQFFTQKSANHLRGWYSRADSVVFFTTEGLTRGGKSVENIEPDIVTVTLEVNGARIDHRFDYEAGVLTIDGHGTMLYPEDTRALRSFYPALEKALYEPLMTGPKAAGGDVSLPRSADALHRLATMYSEAPVGIVLDKRVVRRPQERTSPSQYYEGPILGESPFSAPTADAKACQRSHEQGILYLYSPCGKRYNYEYHDANSHCLTAANRSYGCKSNDCAGRCGGGCGWRGGHGTYSHDCHDHDWCGRIHGGSTNPWDAECGDEYFEADDDFAWGKNQCSWYCS